jgi:Predicted transcriptional regulators
MKFSERLKTLRLESGYTQKQLAKLIGISYQSLQKYEKGINKPRLSRLEEIAELFDVSVSYLLGETDIRSQSNLDKAIVLSRRLKDLRIEAGYTQEELAKKIGITGSAYSSYGTGTDITLPRIHRLQKLAETFNVSVSYLLGETDERPCNPKTEPNTFPNRLKLLRTKARYTQEELAKRINLASAQTYNNYERGVRTPPTETIEKLAEFFNVSVEYLVNGTNEKSSSEDD